MTASSRYEIQKPVPERGEAQEPLLVPMQTQRHRRKRQLRKRAFLQRGGTEFLADFGAKQARERHPVACVAECKMIAVSLPDMRHVVIGKIGEQWC